MQIVLEESEWQAMAEGDMGVCEHNEDRFDPIWTLSCWSNRRQSRMCCWARRSPASTTYGPAFASYWREPS